MQKEFSRFFSAVVIKEHYVCLRREDLKFCQCFWKKPSRSEMLFVAVRAQNTPLQTYIRSKHGETKFNKSIINKLTHMQMYVRQKQTKQDSKKTRQCRLQWDCVCEDKLVW